MNVKIESKINRRAGNHRLGHSTLSPRSVNINYEQIYTCTYDTEPERRYLINSHVNVHRVRFGSMYLNSVRYHVSTKCSSTYASYVCTWWEYTLNFNTETYYAINREITAITYCTESGARQRYGRLRRWWFHTRHDVNDGWIVGCRIVNVLRAILGFSIRS